MFNFIFILFSDLVPVSSTVIPLPVYQVGYGFNLGSTLKDEKAKKPDGPITLITGNAWHILFIQGDS